MLTLAESIKLYDNPIASGIVEIFARENPVLTNLPLSTIAGNAYRYNIESALPGVAFRDFNQGYAESTGVINPAVESLTIAGGDSDYDVALLAMQAGGSDARAVMDGLKAKALSLLWLKTFFQGDTSVRPLEFDGLNRRLTGAQVITPSANGDVFNYELLDELIDAVTGTPTMLLMNKSMRRDVRALARDSSVLSVSRDFFGREVDTYQGVPIGIIEDGADGNPILGFTETQGTANNTTSIYAVNFAPDKFFGIQTAPMRVDDLGEIDAKPALRTRVEWYSGLVLKHPKAAARLKGLKKRV